MALRDLFSPKWKHSDPGVRLQAVHELGTDDAEQLVEVAASDPAPEVRLAAVTKLADADQLRTLAAAEHDPEVSRTIRARLDAHYCDSFLAAESDAARHELLGRIQDEERLAALVNEVESSDLRVTILESIGDERLLCRIAESPCGRQAGLYVVGRLSSEELLQRVAERGSSKTVRQRAADRAASIEAERNRPTPEAMRQTRLQELCTTAEELSASWHLEFAAEQMQAAREEWAKLDPEGTHPLRPRFEAAHSQFSEHHRELRERQFEDEQRAAERAAAIARREELCARLEAVLKRPDNTAAEAVEETQREWTEAAPVSGETGDLLEQRFRLAERRFDEARRAWVEHEQQVAARQRVLETACEQAEELAASEDWDAADAALQELCKAHAAPPPDLAELAPLYDRIAAARARFGERRKAARKEARHEREARAERLEALCVEVEKLADAEDRTHAVDAVKAARDEFNAITDVPARLRNQLRRRFRGACDRFYQALREQRESQDWERWANLTLKQQLCAAAEKLQEAEDLPAAAKEIKELQQRWKQAGPAPRAEEQQVWERFHTACDTAYQRCKAYFAERRAEREANLEKKRVLCERVEAIADSTDWRRTTDQIKALQEEWRQIGPVPRPDSQIVYDRLRAACDRFFNRRRAYFQEQRREREQNLAGKEKLAVEAESLKDSTDWRPTAERLKVLQRQWKELGPTPQRRQDQELWERFHGACDCFFTRLENLRPDNLKRKVALCEQAEALLAEEHDEAKAGEVAGTLIAMQRQWQEIGPAPADEEHAVWQRFHKTCDSFFAGRREERERNQQLKENLATQAAALAHSTEWQEVSEALKSMQAKWKEIGPAPPEHERELGEAFREACNTFFTRLKRYYARQDENLRKKEELCTRVELLAGIETKPARTEDNSLSLADQLKMAFEANFITNAHDERSSRRIATEEVRSIQASWRDLGPVPPAAAQSIERRFRHACDSFFRQGRPDQDHRRRESPEEMAENLRRKEALCEEAGRCADADDPAAMLDTVRRCQQQWRQIGRVPSKAQSDALWERFKQACDVVYEAHRSTQGSTPPGA